jgi:hypothetical protein
MPLSETAIRHSTARSSRSNRTCAGPRMGLRSHAGDGQIVRVAFALDTATEVLAWSAERHQKEMIRDLMPESVERRFGAPAQAMGR